MDTPSSVSLVEYLVCPPLAHITACTPLDIDATSFRHILDSEASFNQTWTPLYHGPEFSVSSTKCRRPVPYEHIMTYTMTFVGKFTEAVVGTGLFDLCHTHGVNPH